MADIGEGGGGGHKKGPGVKKGKKVNPRVDLTPMVDLGFLLITFFIFTTTMSTPTAMSLYLPKDTEKPEEQNKAKESGALTLMLAKDRNVFYYEGILAEDGSNFKSTNFKELRNIILDKKSRTDAKDLVIVIKPNKDSKFKDVVDALDEMTINDIKRYALVDIAEPEQKLIEVSQGASQQ
ncbi:MAG: biopolymer transporter ExbD [Chitinophagaceae bacterium]|nr:biopolymer transporter ExbD [Chitinophagaceae bacterium]